MKKMKTSKSQEFDRVIVSLPKPLIGDLRRYSQLFRGGNKSGFVADAVRNHIAYLRKLQHTAKLREAYAASAKDSFQVHQIWDPLSAEAWKKIEEPADK
jgi:metal-responsive CopG/Arc/MetJ family transcriptional regulator